MEKGLGHLCTPARRRVRWQETIPLYQALMHIVLKIVTPLPWENIQNAIICVGTSRSYPSLFISLCAPDPIKMIKL